VRFVPVDAAKGMVASGLTGSDGRFRLTTTNPNDGAIPGEYIVLVSFEEVKEAPGGMATAPGGTGMRPDQMAGQFQKMTGEQRKAGGEKPGKKATKIPAKYGDPKSPSPLKAKVPAQGDIELDLRSQGG